MVSLMQRMRRLQTKLLAIRLGSGAAVLPREVKRIHLRFAAKSEGGHMGARKFWRHELVRLKYHNPAVPMTVDRTALNSEPAVMSVSFAAHTSDSPTSAASPVEGTERVEQISMNDYTNSEIMDALTRVTKAYPIEPTPEDREELAKLEEQRRRSAIDSKLSQEVRARVKREKELLEQARGDVAAQAA